MKKREWKDAQSCQGVAMTTIYDIVSAGEIPLVSDEESELLITWNQSLTYNIYLEREGGWEAVDCRTVITRPTLAAAYGYADRLLQEHRKGDE